MSSIIRTIIVDDIASNIDLLVKMLQDCDQTFEVLAKDENIEDAIRDIDNNKPELVFLDINFPEDRKGFEILEKTNFKEFAVIFTTVEHEHAIKAFEFSALHFLLKPINLKMLQEAINRFEVNRNKGFYGSQINVLNDSLKRKHKRIILPTIESFDVVEIEDIIYCESENNYTTFHMRGDDHITVCKPINSYDQILSDLYFVRIHSKYLINLKYLKKYHKGRGGIVQLENGLKLEVSEGKKKDFLQRLSDFAGD